MDPLEQQAHDALKGKELDVIIGVWEQLFHTYPEIANTVRQLETENILNPSSENQRNLDSAKAELKRNATYQKVAGEIIQTRDPDYFARYHQTDTSQKQPRFKKSTKVKLAIGALVGAGILWLGGQGASQRQVPEGFDPTDLGTDSPTRKPPQPLTPEQLETEFCDVDYGMGATLANSSLWEAEGNRERAREILREKLEVFDGERGCGPENIDAAVEEGSQEIDQTIANFGIDDIPGSRTLIQCEDGAITTVQAFGKDHDYERGQNCPVDGLSRNVPEQTRDGKGIVLERGGL